MIASRRGPGAGRRNARRRSRPGTTSAPPPCRSVPSRTTPLVGHARLDRDRRARNPASRRRARFTSLVGARTPPSPSRTRTASTTVRTWPSRMVTTFTMSRRAACSAGRPLCTPAIQMIPKPFRELVEVVHVRSRGDPSSALVQSVVSGATIGHDAILGDVDYDCDEIAALAARLDAIGCTDDEIDRVRVDQGGDLPRSVECFLRWLGRDVGGLFGGSEVGYPHVLGMKDAARQILDAYRADHVGVFQLPDDAVVISMHQGYAFEFVRCSSGENPPVEWWAEGTTHPRHPGLGHASIAEWLRAEMEKRYPGQLTEIVEISRNAARETALDLGRDVSEVWDGSWPGHSPRVVGRPDLGPVPGLWSGLRRAHVLGRADLQNRHASNPASLRRYPLRSRSAA